MCIRDRGKIIVVILFAAFVLIAVRCVFLFVDKLRQFAFQPRGQFVVVLLRRSHVNMHGINLLKRK